MDTTAQHRARGGAAGVPSVHRAVAVLGALVEAQRPLSLSELSRSLGLPKSSAHGLCLTLTQHGYLRRVEQAFSIGPAVMPLAHAFLRSTSIPAEFGRLWSEQESPSTDTVVLSLLAGREVLYVAARNGSRPLGLAFSEGMQLPAHLAASGKAMLAWKSERELRDLYRNEHLPKLTHAGPEGLEQLLADLRIVRESGYSVDDECVREGVVSFAAPVFDRTGAAVAGIGLCVHKTASDFSFQGYPRRVVDLAQQLTRRIGGTFPQPPAA